MKISTDTITTILGLVAGASGILGQTNILDTKTASLVSSLALAISAYYTNKTGTVQNNNPLPSDINNKNLNTKS